MTLLAGIYVLDNDLENAEKICQTILELNPNSVPGHIRLGLVYKAMGQDGLALASFEKALELSPSETGILNHIAAVYMDKEQYDKALEEINRYRSSVNKGGKALIENLTGKIYLKKKDSKTASRHFKKAIELDPFLFQAHMSLAGIYRRNNEIIKSETLYKAILDVNASYLPALMELGIISEMNKDWGQAEIYYNAVLKIDPYYAFAANNLAFLLTEKEGNLEKAMNLARLAREKLPNDPNVMDTLGWIYYQKGIYSDAIAELEKSLSLKPDNALACYHMGMALYRTREIKRAKQYLRKALDLDPDFRGAQKVKNILIN